MNPLVRFGMDIDGRKLSGRGTVLSSQIHGQHQPYQHIHGTAMSDQIHRQNQLVLIICNTILKHTDSSQKNISEWLGMGWTIQWSVNPLGERLE